MLVLSCSCVKGARKKVRPLVGLVIFTTNFISHEVGSLLHVLVIEGLLLVAWG